MNHIIATFLSAGLAVGCATTNRTRILQTTIGAGAVGTAFGYSKVNNPSANAALHGGLSAAIAGLIGHYIWNSDAEAEKYKVEAQALGEELDRVRKPQALIESPATFGAKIPAKYRALIRPGSWRVSQIDQWIEDGENRLIHQDSVMELIPPTLNPVRTSGGTK